MTGALIQNTDRQPKPAMRAPPVTGPAAMLSPKTDAQTPIACARSLGSGIALTTIARATGLSIEAPIPWTARAAISTPTEGAIAQTSEAAPNTTRPTWNTRRRPSRSASAPEEIRRLARTSVYASTVHSRLRVPMPRPCPIAGSPTLTMVVSRPTRNMLRQQTARTVQRLRALRAGRIGSSG